MIEALLERLLCYLRLHNYDLMLQPCKLVLANASWSGNNAYYRVRAPLRAKRTLSVLVRALVLNSVIRG